MTRSGLRLGSIACSLALAAAVAAAPAAAQKKGGSLTVGLELDIPGFDPLKVGVYDTAANIAATLMLETLVSLDDNGKPKPSLALSWSSSEDFRTWTFKLRPDVKFHDGTPFNAQAVKWNLERQKDPKNNCRCAFYISNIVSIDAKDDLTVVYTLKDPAVNFPALLTRPDQNQTVHSPTAIQAKGDDYNRNPVGTGPFVLKSWTAGDRLVVERNPNYWDKARPYLDRVVLRPLPDAQSRFASLKSGETDVVWADEAEADNIMRARNDKTLQVLTYAGSGAAVNAINTKVPPLDDVRVRRALVMALDRKKMSQALTNGLARPASNPYGDGSWVKCKDDGALPEDPKKAAELIKEYGKPVAFKMLFTATPRGRAAAQVYQQLWKQVGAEMEIEMVDQSTFPPRAFQRKFDVIGWRIVDFPDPDVQMFANFHTGSPVALANYSNPELDKLLQRARVTPDEAKRTEDYCAISRIINQEAIWFWTFQNTYYAMAKAKVKGVPKLYGGVIDVSNAWLD
ncbi:ABC transporter substrate-binding protein [Reyranella sp. CPCC 100927]|uniref:ABC transporter substrate-binding protein n=1 Tax=Reyranella sp. CPCC 100927 TaxID=2599616 RepID=UPI0011B4E55D|nr:ABC transporter substrate-binding protein [Reyranella sp. CPCC 100927]TWT02682.1 ABC transporter substrate-binding protein [Reyranella sp. CPCC 100927]